MPRGDGTGPSGVGPMTGRRAGYCAGFNMPGYTQQPVFGCGFGLGRGRGGRMFQGAGRYGFAHGGRAFDMVLDGADEKAQLQRRADMMEQELAQFKKRLSRMDGE